MNKLEKMDEFFAARTDGYDEHMRTTIEGASDFYEYTASLLPKESNARILDLGCGTGLELEELFKINPEASVTGIDLSEAMLNKLKEKFPDKKINLINNSYFDEPLGENVFDAAVSVESLHHFKADKKENLYRKLFEALKADGYFVLTDYFAESEELEKEYFENLKQLKAEQGLSDDEFYHYDTPLTKEHEIEALKRAGFTDVRVMKEWGHTVTLLAKK
ncbi:MAG: class I SAM-dependent methyltransferase [Lachnospiraceae bacterium]|nr:class I SAM-dependent methyltransferase [Lachnospiraceae bacterium]